MYRAWLLALALSSVPVLAPAQTAPNAAAPAQAAPDPAAVAAFQRKATLYSNLLLESRQIAIDMVERIGAINRASVDPDAIKAPFDDSWGPRLKAQAASLKTRIEAAPPIAGTEVTALYPPGSASAAEAAKLIGSYPAMLKDTLTFGTGLIDKTLELGPAAMKGDVKAQVALAGAMFGGMKAAVAAENLQLELSGTTFSDIHPQHALTESSVASNRAMIEFFGLMNNQAEGRNVDLVGAARRIRAHAEESRAAAETVPKLTTAMVADIEAQTRAQGLPLAAGQLSALDSYKTSAANEIAITDQLSVVAVTLAEKGIAAGVEEAWSDIETLVDRRFRLDEQRRAALSR